MAPGKRLLVVEDDGLTRAMRLMVTGLAALVAITALMVLKPG